VLRATVGGIEGLRVVGEPIGPLFAVASDHAVAADRRVDPHHWADRVRELGFLLQQQPGFVQPGGSALDRTTHLPITPVTANVLDELSAALTPAADAVRGKPAATVPASIQSAFSSLPDAPIDSATAGAMLDSLALGAGGLPTDMAPVMALIEALPAALTERLLVELLGRLSEPHA